MADAPAKPLCIGCLLMAISKHSDDLLAWLHAGGDARLLEFTPIKSWTELVGMIAAAQLSDKKVREHLHS